MGHRDIWGKDSKKWKKQCPCFDAEKEYEEINNMSFTKSEDTPPSTPTSVSILKPDNYIYNINKIKQWNNVYDINNSSTTWGPSGSLGRISLGKSKVSE